MRQTQIVALLWFAFVLRGMFYSLEQPLWEGFDEWAHFAYVRHVAIRHTLPDRHDQIDPDIQASLDIVPLSASARELAHRCSSPAEFWRLTHEQRLEREQQIHQLGMRDGTSEAALPLLQYEAQQPPLYYALMLIPYLAVRADSLHTQVIAMRLCSVLLASMCVLLVYMIGRRVLPEELVIFPSVLVAAFPGFFINVSRVGNDSLAAVLAALIVMACTRICSGRDGWPEWLGFGILLGAGGLVKAYMLALLPLLLVAAVFASKRRGWVPVIARCLCAGFVTVAVCGWWYVRSVQRTGSISGEQLDIAASKAGVASKLRAIRQVDWVAVADTAAFSHIWVGGWSFLTARSWMYRTLEAVAALACAGVILLLLDLARARSHLPLVRHRDGWSCVVVLVTACAGLCAAVAYHALAIFIVQNRSLALGWYLHAAVVPEVLLLVLGLAAVLGVPMARRVLIAVAVALVALDVYTMHFLLMPFHGGVIAHRASGGLETFTLSRLSEVGGAYALVRRICAMKPWWPGVSHFLLCWVAYAVATLSLIVAAVVKKGQTVTARD